MSDLYYDLPELSPDEKELPISKYYTDYPLHKPNPLYSQLLDQGHGSKKRPFPGSLA